MTKKKFTEHVLKAMSLYSSCGSEVDEIKEFAIEKIGMFYEINSDGSNARDQYILIEFKNGSHWRVKPERALKLEEYEDKLWSQLDEPDGDIDDTDSTTQ